MRRVSSGDLIKRLCPPRQRYLMAIVLGLCCLVFYSTVLSFQQAKSRMVASPFVQSTSSICRFNTSRKPPPQPHRPDRRHKWSEIITTQINYASYCTYIPFHFLAGPLVVRYSPKKILMYSVLATGLSSFTLPFFLFDTYTDYVTLIVSRLVAGAGTGISFPTAHAILSFWVPARDRGKLGAIVFSFLQITPVFTLEFGTYILQKTSDPRMIFYTFGGLTIGWVLLWICIGRSNYEETTAIREEERDYLRYEMVHEVYLGPKKIPWLQITKSLPLWALTVASIGRGAMSQILIFIVPHYIRTVLGYKGHEFKFLLQTLPYVLGTCMLLFMGFYSDYSINKGYIQRTTWRKICTLIGAMGPAFFLLTIPYAECELYNVVLHFLFTIILATFFYCGPRINTLDLAPNFTAVVVGIAHGFESIGALVTNILMRIVLFKNTIEKWTQLFWGLLLVMAITSFVYVLFASAEVQPWNYVEDPEKKVNFEDDNYSEVTEDEYPLNETPKPGTSSMN